MRVNSTKNNHYYGLKFFEFVTRLNQEVKIIVKRIIIIIIIIIITAITKKLLLIILYIKHNIWEIRKYHKSMDNPVL